jgi:hypothetical protein
MRRNCIIDWTDDMNSGGSDTEKPRCYRIPMILPGNGLLAINCDGMTVMQNACAPNGCWYVSKVSVNGASTEAQRKVNGASTECQQSVNDFSLNFSAIKGLHSDINPKRISWPTSNVKWQAICSFPHPRNERQRNGNNSWSCILDTD